MSVIVKHFEMPFNCATGIMAAIDATPTILDEERTTESED